MKTVFVVLVSLCVFGFAFTTFAADPVDLSGKKGVVDPQDLKKYDPKPPKVQGNPPPVPGSDNRPKTQGNSSLPHMKGAYGQAK